MNFQFLKYLFVILLLNSSLLFPEFSSLSGKTNSGIEETNSLWELIYEDLLGFTDTNPEDEDDDSYDYQISPEEDSFSVPKFSFLVTYFICREFFFDKILVVNKVSVKRTRELNFISTRTGVPRYISLFALS